MRRFTTPTHSVFLRPEPRPPLNGNRGPRRLDRRSPNPWSMGETLRFDGVGLHPCANRPRAGSRCSPWIAPWESAATHDDRRSVANRSSARAQRTTSEAWPRTSLRGNGTRRNMVSDRAAVEPRRSRVRSIHHRHPRIPRTRRGLSGARAKNTHGKRQVVGHVDGQVIGTQVRICVARVLWVVTFVPLLSVDDVNQTSAHSNHGTNVAWSSSAGVVLSVEARRNPGARHEPCRRTTPGPTRPAEAPPDHESDLRPGANPTRATAVPRR